MDTEDLEQQPPKKRLKARARKRDDDSSDDEIFESALEANPTPVASGSGMTLEDSDDE